MRPDLVIFDCDGVLVDSEPATLELVLADLATRGLPLSEAEADRLFTGGTMAANAETARRHGADLPDSWVEEIYDRMYARLAEGVPVIEGVARLLDRLDAAGIPYCVGSNGAERKMRITLTPSGLWQRFEGRMYSAHTHGTAKPDPGLFLLAARAHGADPARTVVIDDSPAGVRAGIAAGMPTLGFAARTPAQRLAELGATVIHSMEEAAAHLGLD
jgi:HAD superfamily hydrolase (TIGR01509 family)